MRAPSNRYGEIVRKHWLDWHLNDWIKNVAAAVEADAQVQMFVDAGIQAVGCFCKDHYGNCFYPTDVGHRHPNLSRDYVGEMTRALKARGLMAIAYYSVGADRFTGLGHPDWQMRDRDGRPRRGVWIQERGLGAAPCLNSPYTEQVVLPELAEIARRYDVDGFLLDMATWQVSCACYCPFCREGFRQATGQEIPSDPGDSLALVYRRWRNRHNEEFERKVRVTLDQVRPGILLGSNAAYSACFPLPPSPYVDYLFRDPGQFYPLTFSVWGRYFASTGLPFEMETVRSNGWGDYGLRPTTALLLECTLNLVHGATLSITDQPNTDGSLEPEVYHRIGEVYRAVAALEPFCRGTTSVPYVAVLHSAATHWSQAPLDGSYQIPEAVLGAHKALVESGYHFDIVNEATLERSIDAYTTVVLPEQTALPVSTTARIREFVARGGGLVASSACATSDEQGRPLTGSALADVLGVALLEPSPFPLGYLRPEPTLLAGALQHALPIPVEGRCLRTRLTTAQSVCPLLEPVEEWLEPEEEKFFTTRNQPPIGRGRPWPGVTVNSFGSGVAVYASVELFAGYWRNNLPDLKRLIARCLELAIPPQRRLLEVTAPPSVEVALRRRGSDLVLHLVNFHAEKRQVAPPSIEWLPTIDSVPVALRCPQAPRRVSAIPGGEEIRWQFANGVLRFVLQDLGLHRGALVELS